MESLYNAKTEPWPQDGEPGILHHYATRLTAFEFTVGQRHKPHTLLFAGGLGDGIGTNRYLHDLSEALAGSPWSVVQIHMSSSFDGWGTGSLTRDTEELASCIRHLAKYKLRKHGTSSKTVLMGQSTGCQDLFFYISAPNPHPHRLPYDPALELSMRPSIEGAILQAAVSDREAYLAIMKDGCPWDGQSAEEVTKFINAMKDEALKAPTDHDVLLPSELTTKVCAPGSTPINARRFLSLLSPESPEDPREDDFFSSDLSDARLAQTFGAIRDRGVLKGKLVVLQGSDDPSMPSWIDKAGLLARWAKATGDEIWDHETSTVIPGATHTVDEPDRAGPREVLVQTVAKYLSGIHS
ncbi:hypothetical protein PYCC9005_001226 [Savitreella phatthalungensis]